MLFFGFYSIMRKRQKENAVQQTKAAQELQAKKKAQTPMDELTTEESLYLGPPVELSSSPSTSTKIGQVSQEIVVKIPAPPMPPKGTPIGMPENVIFNISKLKKKEEKADSGKM